MAETVTVALKHPHGLVLQLVNMVDVTEQGLGTSRTVKVAQRVGEKIRLNGYSVSTRGSEVPLPATKGEFALTHGVPKDFMDAWLEQNKDLDIVRSGLLKVSSSIKGGDLQGYAREYKGLKSGLEPLDPSKPPLPGVSTYKKDE